MSSIYELARGADCTDLAEQLGLTGRRTGAGRGKYACPFHDDHTPSMVTYPQQRGEKSHYHCFSCSAHGDAIDLYARVRSTSLTEAAEALCKDLGYDGEEICAASRATPSTPPPPTRPAPDIRVVLAICEEWRKYRIDRAEQCLQACLAAMARYADPDDWRWRSEMRLAGHYQDERNRFAAMTDWETLETLREEMENLGVTPYGRVLPGGEVHEGLCAPQRRVSPP